MATLLLIDDEPAIRHAFQRAFRSPAYDVVVAGSAAEGLAVAARFKPDVVVLDIHLPDASGLQTFNRLHELDARVPVVLITGHGTTELAIEAIKQGAFDYLVKPLELGALRELIARACAGRTSCSTNSPEGERIVRNDLGAAVDGDVLVGQCPAMQEVYKAIGRVAPTDATVLILGDSGTGKELVARAIFQHSKRADQPFLAINCAAIPEPLLESELFGHERGAFTGADRKRIGKFEQCHGGTLFLDEVGDMTPLTQTKVLRVLQEQQFERVGGQETIRTDVRIIAATNADLEARVAQGLFRPDLYYRLNVFTIRLPTLRDRGDDLELLVDYYLNRFSRELGRPVPRVLPETLTALRQRRWPGNVRELQSVIKQALLQMRGETLLPQYLPALTPPPGTLTASAPASATESAGDWQRFVDQRLSANSHELYAEALASMEREVITRVLRHTEGNQVQAARILGITRGSLRTKIRALHIAIGRSVWSEDDQTD